MYIVINPIYITLLFTSPCRVHAVFIPPPFDQLIYIRSVSPFDCCDTPPLPVPITSGSTGMVATTFVELVTPTVIEKYNSAATVAYRF